MEYKKPKKKTPKKQASPKSIKAGSVYVLPLTKRPFFPGMAASLTIEPGPFYEALRSIAKSEDRYVALSMTKKENIGIYSVGFNDLHPIGVLAKVLRVAPLQEQGAQVFLSVECRIELKNPQSAN